MTTSLVNTISLIGAIALLSACQTNTKQPNQSLESVILNDLLVAEFALKRDNLVKASHLYSTSAQALNNNELAARSTYAAQQSDSPEQYVKASQAWVAIVPNNPEAKQHLAQAILAQDNEKEAEAILLASIKNHRKYLPAPILLAGLYLRNGEPQKADEILIYYTQQNTIDPQLGALHVQALSTQKLFTRSQALLERLLKQYPIESQWRFLLAATYLETGQSSVAERLLLEGLDINPSDSQLHFHTGVFYEQTNRKRLALKHYGQVTSGPNLRDSLEAQLELTQITPANASSLFEQWQKQYQSSPEIVARLYWREGNYYLEQKKPQQALTTFQQGLGIFPSYVDLIYSLALLQAQLQDWAAAENNLQHLLLIDPDNALALNALGYCYADQNKQLTLAKEYITKALSLRPGDPTIIDSAGWVAYQLGDLETALEYLTIAWQALPNAEITAHLGAVEWALGNSQKAFILWNKILIKDPHNDIIKRVMNEAQARYPLPQ